MARLKLGDDVASRSINHAASVMQCGVKGQEAALPSPGNPTMRPRLSSSPRSLDGDLWSRFSARAFILKPQGCDTDGEMRWHQSEASEFHWWKRQQVLFFFIRSACDTQRVKTRQLVFCLLSPISTSCLTVHWIFLPCWLWVTLKIHWADDTSCLHLHLWHWSNPEVTKGTQ